MMNDEDFKKFQEESEEYLKYSEKRYEARCEFTNFVKTWAENHQIPLEGQMQLIRLMSHWIMFCHNIDAWRKPIDDIEKSINFLK